MGIMKVDAYEYLCDGCGSIEVITDSMMPTGYVGGNVIWHHKNGGEAIEEWFACKPTCIKDSISNLFRNQK